MLGTLQKIFNESNVVALVRMGTADKVTAGGFPFLRVHTEVLDTFRGNRPASGKIDIDFLDIGPGGAKVEPGLEAVVFIKTEGGGARYKLHPHSSPLTPPAEGRDAFLQALREWSKAAMPSTPPDALRAHVMKMLQSGMPFFRDDASRTAIDLKGWSPAEIESMITLVNGDEDHPPIEGLARDNLVPTVVKWAASPRATTFAKDQVKKGNAHGVYIGLDSREGKDKDTILAALLDDPEEKVVAGGLKVAGLLRRADLLDAFEARYKEIEMPDAVKAALEEARKLVKRDL